MALFQGEEFGHIGSRRFVRDLASFECEQRVEADLTRRGAPLCTRPVYPSLAFEDLSLDSIEAIIAVDQIASTSSVFLHPTDNAQSLAESILAISSKFTDSEVNSSFLKFIFFHKFS